MNNLYAETAVELVKTYRLLKKVVAGEGEGHMLNGSGAINVFRANKDFQDALLAEGIYRLPIWGRFLVDLVSGIIVGVVGTMAHRMGASMNIPYGR